MAWVPRRIGRLPSAGRSKLGVAARQAARDPDARSRPRIARADVVHVHSNGLLPELAALLAQRAGKPVVLTLYGTEIWHYRPKRFGPDLFTRAYHGGVGGDVLQRATAAHAQELGLTRRDMDVVYPPVGAGVHLARRAAQQVDARAALGIANRHLLVNVKRLHPLAGQRYLIDAMNEVDPRASRHALVICGTGPLLGELQAMARSAGVERHVTFAGLVDNSAGRAIRAPPPISSSCRRCSKRCRPSRSKRWRAARP